MVQSIFINLPVKDLKQSIAFFEKIGFTIDQKYTDAESAGLIIADNIFAMLLSHDKFSGFTAKSIADATQTTEALFALEVDSRQEVDELFDKAIAAGATTYREPEDHGWMYGKSFADLDGHQWEIFWMDPEQNEEDEA
jgi:uncharacterized protein